MTPKEYYNYYHANDNLYEIDEILIEQVINSSPKVVFDFGCGTGKNIAPLRKHGINVIGLDLSLMNISHARLHHHIQHLIIGDEETLKHLRYFDLIMTCSVLCHIKDIDNIILEFQRLSPCIIIAETNDIVGEFYFPHDYESYGFEDMEIDWYSKINKATYKFYKYDRMS
jgi:2-polyprenyl-3-methyl-5-hydroxy-6-metoxy-1,4-benzoquinol methylase